MVSGTTVTDEVAKDTAEEEAKDEEVEANTSTGMDDEAEERGVEEVKSTLPPSSVEFTHCEYVWCESC